MLPSLSTSQTQPSRGSESQVTDGTTKQPQNASSGTHSQPKYYIGRTVAPEPAQQHMQAGSSQHEESTPHQSSGAYKIIEAAPHPEIKTPLETTKMDKVSSITMGRTSPLSEETVQTSSEGLTTTVHGFIHQGSEDALEKSLDVIEKNIGSIEDKLKKLEIHPKCPPIQKEKDGETELNQPCLTETTELGATTMARPLNEPEIPISSMSKEQLNIQREKTGTEMELFASKVELLAAQTESLTTRVELLEVQTKLNDVNTRLAKLSTRIQTISATPVDAKREVANC